MDFTVKNTISFIIKYVVVFVSTLKKKASKIQTHARKLLSMSNVCLSFLQDCVCFNREKLFLISLTIK